MSSKLRIVPELMLETNELNRQNKFISDDINNNLKNWSSSFGVIRNYKTDFPFDNFKIISGSSSGTIALQNESIAIDKDALYIRQEAFDNVAVPSGSLYHIVISHQYTHVETGTVSITVDGIVSGVGTEFTKVLRGQPLFPTKIKFYNSGSNTGEYQVVEIASDGIMVIAGSFVAESNLRYSVIGTFTPTALIPVLDREIYNYDSCLFQIIDDVSYLAMTLVAGKEFQIATVTNTLGVIEVKDLRLDMHISLDRDFVDASANVHLLPVLLNPIIGVESAKYDHTFATKDKNEVSIAWGFRSSNWTMEPSLRKVTMTSGEGGVYKTSAQFITGDFDGWRLYNEHGDYKTIITSTKSGTSINLIVESLDTDEYVFGEQLLIVPNVEEVIIHVQHDAVATDIPLVDNEYSFPVNTAVAKIYLLVPSFNPYLYNLSYKYKRFNRYSELALFPVDAIGYYDETSYDDGIIKPNPIDRTRYPYTPVVDDGYVRLLPSPDAYAAVVARVDTGDVIGVRKIPLTTALFSPTFPLFVGTDLQYQHFVGAVYNMTADSPIELMKTRFDSTPLRNGNYFMLHFKQNVLDGGGTKFLRIVQDFVNPSLYTLLYEFTQDDYLFLNGGSPEGIWIRATFYTDGVNIANDTWILSHTNESSVNQLALDIATINAALPTIVPVGTMVDFPVSAPPTGWLMCDGQAVSRTTYSTLFALFLTTFGIGDGFTTFNLPDFRKRVSLGYDSAGTTNPVALNKDDENYGLIGAIGGERTHVLTIPEMPQHNHEVLSNTGNTNGYGSGATTSDQGTYESTRISVGNNGGSLSHENRQPYIVMAKIIKF